VLGVVAVLVFLLLRLTPGDPAAILAGDAATADNIAAIRTSLGLDRPLVVQFGIWLGKVLTGDLGQSFYYRMDVASLIAQRLEPTCALALLTIAIAVLAAVPLGVLAAWRHGGWQRRSLSWGSSRCWCSCCCGSRRETPRRSSPATRRPASRSR